MNTAPFGNGLAVTVLFVTGMVSGCQAPTDHALIIAVTATSAESRPSVGPITGLVTRHALSAVEPRGGITTIVTASTSDTVQVDLTPLRNDHEVEQDTERGHSLVESKLGQLDAALQAARAQRPGLDMLGLFRRAMEVSRAGDSVILYSSGAATVDPVDLRRLGWAFDPEAVARDLATRGLVPDASGRDLYYVGLGVAAGTQPVFTLPEANQIAALNTALCRAAHARSCHLLGGDVPRLAPTADQPVPLLTVQDTQTRCLGTTELPSDVLFGRGSAVLSPQADAILASLAQSLQACPANRIVTVTGHTSAELHGDHGWQLSLARARAVKERLIVLGVLASGLTEPIGAGDSQPLVNNLPGGRRDESLARINQRVTVTVTQKGT